MEKVYTLWDTEEAYPMYTYHNKSEALAEVAAAVQAHGEEAVATWGLFLATPEGGLRETIAVGNDLALLAMREQRGIYATRDA